MALLVRPELSAQWIDAARFTIRRGEHGSVCIFTFLSELESTPPEVDAGTLSMVETVRVAFMEEQAKKIVKAMCDNLGYYPTKDAAAQA